MNSITLRTGPEGWGISWPADLTSAKQDVCNGGWICAGRLPIHPIQPNPKCIYTAIPARSNAARRPRRRVGGLSGRSFHELFWCDIQIPSSIQSVEQSVCSDSIFKSLCRPGRPVHRPGNSGYTSGSGRLPREFPLGSSGFHPGAFA